MKMIKFVLLLSIAILAIPESSHALNWKKFTQGIKNLFIKCPSNRHSPDIPLPSTPAHPQLEQLPPGCYIATLNFSRKINRITVISEYAYKTGGIKKFTRDYSISTTNDVYKMLFNYCSHQSRTEKFQEFFRNEYTTIQLAVKNNNHKILEGLRSKQEIQELLKRIKNAMFVCECLKQSIGYIGNKFEQFTPPTTDWSNWKTPV